MQIKELGHVVLYVSNLTRLADFYTYTLGFHEIHRDHQTALYSSGRTHHELLLIEVGGELAPRTLSMPGLYHIGFKIGDTPDDLKAAYRELKEKGVTIIGSGDHTVTHSLYILDPDGNELELYADVSDAWRTDAQAILTPVQHLHLGE